MDANINIINKARGLFIRADIGKSNKPSFSIPRFVTCFEIFDGQLKKIDGLQDPLVFISGRNLERMVSSQKKPQPPFLTILTGSYGAGKTECIDQLQRHLESLDEVNRLLPISLARVRMDMNTFKKQPDAAAFQKLLFEQFEMKPHELVEILRDIAQGKIILAIDSLDELLNDRESYQHFLSGFYKFLDALKIYSEGKLQYRILLTMRSEFLAALDGQRADYLVKKLFKITNLWLLELDLFDHFQLESYFAMRILKYEEYEDIFEHVVLNNKLLSTLCRPLLAHTFLDLVTNGAINVLDIDDDIWDETAVLKLYIDEVNNDSKKRWESLDHPWVWDRDLLAQACLKLYGKGSNHLDSEDIKEVCVSTAHAPLLSPPKIEDAMLAVLKCPFLLRDGEEKVRFSHRAFFEYLTSLGMLIDVEEYGDNSVAFNEFVLNADMRLYLRSLIENSEKLKQDWNSHYRKDDDHWLFHALTKRSCGLHPSQKQEWTMPKEDLHKLWVKLCEVQEKLLDGMTEPLQKEDESTIRAHIEWFIEEQNKFDVENIKPPRLHPLFLVYANHAVATYIFKRPLQPEWLAIKEKFSKNIAIGLRQALSILYTHKNSGNGVPDDYWQWFVERVLTIGLWLRLASIREFLIEMPSNEWFSDNWELKSRSRLEHVLRAIESEGF